MTNIYTWWDRPRTVTGKPRRRARQVRLFMRAARRANVSQRRVVLLFSNVVEHAFGTRYWLVCVSPLDGRRVGPLRRSFDERTPTELTRHHPARMRPCSLTNRSPKMRTVPCSDSVGTVSLAVSVHTAPSNCQRGRRREE